MANIYLKLLEEFESTGLSSRKSISPFMVKNFKKPTSEDEQVWFNQNANAIIFLEDVRHTGHFEFDENENFLIRFDYLTKEGRWYDVVDINARITIGGLEYLEKQKTNNVTKRNSNLQTGAIFLTVLFTLVTLSITINNSNSSDELSKLQTRIQQQSQQIHMLQIELSKATNILLLELEAKKTSPKKL